MKPAPDLASMCANASDCMQQTDINWLLQQAAHRLTTALNTEAMSLGVGIRGYIVLTGLCEQEHTNQLKLAAALGVDKTTLTAELDRLEADGLIMRKPDPNDRRARIPVATEEGRAFQAKVSVALQSVTDHVLSPLSEEEQKVLRALLVRLVHTPLAKVAPPGPC